MAQLRHVFCLVTDCYASTGYYRQLWRQHFEEGVQASVQRCVFPTGVNFDFSRGPEAEVAARPIEKLRAEVSDKLLPQIIAAHKSFGLDAVLSYAYSKDLDPALIKEITRLGIPWINFYCDSTHRFSLVQELAASATLNWFPEHAAIESYRKLGRSFVCLPYAVTEKYLPDLTTRDAKRSAAFIGLPTSNRIRQLGMLIKLGNPIHIRGKGWVEESAPFHNPVPMWKRLASILAAGGYTEKLMKRIFWPTVRKHAGPPLDEGEFFEFIRATQVMIGLNQGVDEQGRYSSYLKFRDVEFPGYGCCYLTERNEDIVQLYEPGREILLYAQMREASEHIKRANRDPKWASEIGRRARQRTLAEHTWTKRIEQLEAAL